MFQYLLLYIGTLVFEWTKVLFILDGRVQKVLLLLRTVFTGQTLSRAKFFRADAKTRQVIPSTQRLKTPSSKSFFRSDACEGHISFFETQQTIDCHKIKPMTM